VPVLISAYLRLSLLNSVRNGRVGIGLHGPEPGPGTTNNIGVRPGSGLVQMTAIKSCRENFGFSQAILFFAKKKLFVIAPILCS
jgi:hypothetical protein